MNALESRQNTRMLSLSVLALMATRVLHSWNRSGVKWLHLPVSSDFVEWEWQVSQHTSNHSFNQCTLTSSSFLHCGWLVVQQALESALATVTQPAFILIGFSAIVIFWWFRYSLAGYSLYNKYSYSCFSRQKKTLVHFLQLFLFGLLIGLAFVYKASVFEQSNSKVFKFILSSLVSFYYKFSIVKYFFWFKFFGYFSLPEGTLEPRRLSRPVFISWFLIFYLHFNFDRSRNPPVQQMLNKF